MVIYPLSLAIYCTSWTFFGSVGLGVRTGFDFLAIYVGPEPDDRARLAADLRIVRLAKTQNITSIADFIAARYGKHQAVAATVALIAIVGSIPYIALQLKAVRPRSARSWPILDMTTGMPQPVLGDIALFVALAMAAFRGAVRHAPHRCDRASGRADPRDRDRVADQARRLRDRRAYSSRSSCSTAEAPVHQGDGDRAHAASLTREPVWSTLIVKTLLSTVAIVLVPRQFHVTVVENRSESEIRRAAWLFPLYLVLINLFVIPIAMAGLITFPRGIVDSDMYVLALPLRAGSEMLALVAFVGGLSAATAMVIVETVALAIMASNDIVVPFVLQRREAILSSQKDVGAILLTVRRVAIFIILVFGLSLLPLCRRSAACLHRPAVLRRRRAARAGLLRRPDLARRHRARRARRHDRRHPASGPTRCCCRAFADAGLVGKDILTLGPFGIAGCARSICSGSTCRRWCTACCGASRSTSSPM
jgi:hypothetical protein